LASFLSRNWPTDFTDEADKEVLLSNQGKNLVDGAFHFNLRLVCCDASSKTLCASEAKSISNIF
jgi:hypothetical protein